MNKPNSFKWNKFSTKQKKVLTWWLATDYDGIIADGAVRSGKTLSMAISFVIWAMECFNYCDFALCGKTISALKRNVLNTLKRQIEGLGCTYEEKRTENLIIIRKGNKENYFYTFGGRDESSQDLIQGMTLAGVLFDEVALMPQSFVAQAEARCSVEGAKYWYNCNPKEPTHYFYSEYIRVAEEKNLLYLHFTMDDNLTLSEKVKERYKRQFAGVFYDRNILGLWVTAEGKIYISFTEDNVIPLQDWRQSELYKNIVLCTAGVDFGGNKSSTAFTLTAFTKKFQECIVVKEKRITEEIDPTELEEMFIKWLKECLAEYPMLREVYCDSAEQVLIRGLKAAVVKERLPIAIKNAKKGAIIDRIRFGVSMFAQGRFYMVSNCKETIEAYNTALWDEKYDDVRLDDGTTNIDSIDATEYSQEPYIKAMIDMTITR